jgi:hypothetical protein
MSRVWLPSGVFRSWPEPRKSNSNSNEYILRAGSQGPGWVRGRTDTAAARGSASYACAVSAHVLPDSVHHKTAANVCEHNTSAAAAGSVCVASACALHARQCAPQDSGKHKRAQNESSSCWIVRAHVWSAKCVACAWQYRLLQHNREHAVHQGCRRIWGNSSAVSNRHTCAARVPVHWHMCGYRRAAF